MLHLFEPCQLFPESGLNRRLIGRQFSARHFAKEDGMLPLQPPQRVGLGIAPDRLSNFSYIVTEVCSRALIPLNAGRLERRSV